MHWDPAYCCAHTGGFSHGQIAHNKIPRYVEFVDEFPMTVTGKIQKFMRDDVEARLGLKAAKTA